jgi:phosphatidylglycerol---prolipoprotein diacylglyceryl transferase
MWRTKAGGDVKQSTARKDRCGHKALLINVIPTQLGIERITDVGPRLAAVQRHRREQRVPVACLPSYSSGCLAEGRAQCIRVHRLGFLRTCYDEFVLPFLHVGRLAIPTYGLLVALGIYVAFRVLRADLLRRSIALDAEAVVAAAAIAGIIGAKLYHVLETPRELISDPVGQLLSPFGFAWLGGLLAGVGAFIYMAWHNRIPLLELCDAASPAATIGYGVGRIGCLISGDGDYGVPTSLPWGMSFPNGLVPTTQRVHPTPIYEFLDSILIFWLLWRLGAWQLQLLQEDGRRRLFGEPGVIFATFLIATGIARFLVEFIRINPRSVFGEFTNAQAGSFVSMVAGIALFVYAQAVNKSCLQEPSPNPELRPDSEATKASGRDARRS